MILPQTFRPRKNLDKKIKSLIEKLPEREPKTQRFQDGMEHYGFSFEELEGRTELHDHLQSVTFKFKYGGFRYWLTFKNEDGIVNVKLDYIKKADKKHVVPKATQKVIDAIGEYCETAPDWSQELSQDETVYTWEFKTKNFFDTQQVLTEIRHLCKPPIFKEFEVYCVDLGY